MENEKNGQNEKESPFFRLSKKGNLLFHFNVVCLHNNTHMERRGGNESRRPSVFADDGVYSSPIPVEPTQREKTKPRSTHYIVKVLSSLCVCVCVSALGTNNKELLLSSYEELEAAGPLYRHIISTLIFD